MMKFTVKGLIALFVTSSALFLTPMKSDAQVNMKMLIQVTKSCQKDAISTKYYQNIGVLSDRNTNNYIQKEKNQLIEMCIYNRYHYSLVVSKLPWLNSSGKIMPGYPGAVVVGSLVSWLKGGKTPIYVLDCISSQNAGSPQCSKVKNFMGYEEELRCLDRCTDLKNQLIFGLYEVAVCPSCVVAHDEVFGSQEVILKSFIQWFLKLDQLKRRELISLLGDDDKARQLRESINKESKYAVKKYQEVRNRVERKQKER
ncbi:MAG: hypothetical protein EAZ87_16235 [Nostocales cyanobacterium]|nr:MAG: hypothetical protein EAZ87_16235 [Nostocales cyanobacterium]